METTGPPPSAELERGPDLDAAWVEQVRAALLAWYDRGHRDLPWRGSNDPYAVLVSEVMLVQTTVEAVIPFYRRFLDAFPTIEALAAAPEEAVLKAWEGLGYYRRARQLQAAARAIVERHGGAVPPEVDTLRTLSGIGPYIAGAVSSIAFDRPAAILEANSERVFSRLIGLDEPIEATTSKARLWRTAARLVPNQGAGRFNQAVMELGATICVIRTPRCLGCPVARQCTAFAAGRQESIPIRRARPEPTPGVEKAVIVRREDQVLLVRRGPGRLWEGFWEFPTLHVAGADPARRATEPRDDETAALLQLTGLELRPGPVSATIRYGVTRYRMDLQLAAAQLQGGTIRPTSGFVAIDWIDPSRLDALTMASVQRKAARLASTHVVF